MLKRFPFSDSWFSDKFTFKIKPDLGKVVIVDEQETFCDFVDYLKNETELVSDEDLDLLLICILFQVLVSVDSTFIFPVIT